MNETDRLLDEIRCGLIDVETEQQRTNDLLAAILAELKKANQGIMPPQPFRPEPLILNDDQSMYRPIDEVVKDRLTCHSLERQYSDGQMLPVIQVLRQTKFDLFNVRNFGNASYFKLKQALKVAGYHRFVSEKHWLNEGITYE